MDTETNIIADGVVLAGIGCRRGVAAAEIVALVEASLAEAGLATRHLAALGSLAGKAGESGLIQAAAHFGVPLRFYGTSELEGESARLSSPSAPVREHVGLAGVAEAVALKAGTLLLPKRRSKRATCALGLHGAGS